VWAQGDGKCLFPQHLAFPPQAKKPLVSRLFVVNDNFVDRRVLLQQLLAQRAT
jgi:hypothetical protein